MYCNVGLSNFNEHMNCLGTLLNCSFRFGRSKVAPGAVGAAGRITPRDLYPQARDTWLLETVCCRKQA